ncbi:MAG TPA: cytochrome C [Xanthobacteraceae bacterium]|nr:cytochrome C [Xanthobacteraceae bacterium]
MHVSRAVFPAAFIVCIGLTLLALPTGVASAASLEPPAGATACSGCHPMSEKTSIKFKIPFTRLAGRDPREIESAMQAFRSGQRPSTIMERIARGFSEEEIHAIAVWLAAQQQQLDSASDD